MTTIIRAESAHDFLALVPALVGYPPSASVLCVAFDGNRTAGVLRHDLPDEPQAAEALVGTMVGTICRLAHADAVVPIVYTDDRFADGRMPHRELLELLALRAEEAGFLVRDVLCVAADGWGSVLDERLPPCGRPLALIDESPAGARAAANAPLAGSPAALAALPESDPEIADELERMLDALEVLDRRRWRGHGPDEGVDPADDAALGLVGEIDRTLGEALDPVVAAEELALGREAAPARLAWLIHLLDRPVFRDAMMLQVAFGPVIGELALDAAEEAVDRASQTGEGLDVLLRRELDDPAESVDQFLSRLLLGRAAARPDADRIRRALGTIVVAAANAPCGRRAGALCAAAWWSWALGRGSAAGAMIGRALEADPDHGMARLLSRFFASGSLPEWAFHPGPANGDE
ncbi:DUF4192 family protein [Agromyces arachidis]|uniref:DUF4192 family protein n=1 Tax=Agromyces arachidis TaxID=766966 RepID=UPI0040573999